MTAVYRIITIHYLGESTITTTTRQTKAGEVTRTISISFAIAGRCEVHVIEDNGRKTTTDTYLLTCRPVPRGKAFTVRKLPPAEEVIAEELIYEVVHLLCQKPTCTCPWGRHRRNGKPCRHVEMCLKAIREGKIAAPQQPETPKPEAPKQPEAKPAAQCCPCCEQPISSCDCWDNP